MQDWHFNIEALVTTVEGETVTIYPENFTNLIRIYDFRNKYMPMAMARLSLDKTILDVLTKNAKDATMHLKITKFIKPVDGEDLTAEDSRLASTVEDGDFSIIIENDINYHQEMDYNDPDDAGGSPYDKYREIHVGLVRKACIDHNKIVENTVVHDTTMQDLVLSYMYNAGVHLLIEPFKYNDTQAQLLVPPTDTLTSLVEFLNSIKVFYDSKYIFFIDEPYVTYLLSRSGAGIPMKGEEYNNVIINMNSITTTDPINLGMTIDANSSSYKVDVSVVDSVYNVDHDSAKVVNQISAIVNPSNDNTKDKGENLAKAQNLVESVMAQFKLEIAKAAGSLNNLSGYVSDTQNKINGFIKDQMSELVGFQDKLQNAVMGHLGNIPTSVSVEIGDTSVDVPIMSNAIKSAAGNLFNNMMSQATSSLDISSQVSDLFSKVSGDFIPQTYKFLNLDNAFLSLTNVNVQEVVDKLAKEMNALPGGFSSITSGLGSVTSGMSNVSDVLSSISSITSKGQEVQSILNAVKTGSYYSYIMDQHAEVSQHMEDAMANVAKMGQCVSEMTSVVNQANSTLSQFTNFANKVSGMAGQISGYANTISNLKNFDIKSMYKSTSSVLRQFSNSAIDFNQIKDIDSTITHILGNNNVFNSLKDIDFSNITKSVSGILDFSDIMNLKKNIESFNIDNIGKLGLDNFDAMTNFGGTIDANTKIGTKIMKVRNDNPNEIKTIKAEAETMVNQLSFNKFGLDPTVFTPNKRYIVRNYNGHSDKDGIFILNCRTEVYVREDTTFVCNTRLDLAKIPDNTTEKAQDTSVPNANNTDVKPNKTPSQIKVKQSTSQSTTNTGSNSVDLGKQSPLGGRDKNNPYIIHFA